MSSFFRSRCHPSAKTGVFFTIFFLNERYLHFPVITAKSLEPIHPFWTKILELQPIGQEKEKPALLYEAVWNTSRLSVELLLNTQGENKNVLIKFRLKSFSWYLSNNYLILSPRMWVNVQTCHNSLCMGWYLLWYSLIPSFCTLTPHSFWHNSKRKIRWNSIQNPFQNIVRFHSQMKVNGKK